MVFNIQRFSLDDGPGIRTVVFMKGCPLRCLWCSNPESQNPWPELAHRDSICRRCGNCIRVCPKKAISISANGWSVHRKICDLCGKCVNACVAQALVIWGMKISVEEVISEVLKDLNFYKNSNGGVTFSGGEPLYQPEFTLALLKRCQGLGIHTAIETCGYASRDLLEKILPCTNLILYDLKCPDSKLHKKITGVSNELILKNLKIVAKSGVPTIIRIPIIPGINDSERQIEAFVKIILENELKEVELLPYHRYGVVKYKMLGRKYSLERLMPPTDQNLKRIRDYFTSQGLICRIIKN